MGKMTFNREQKCCAFCRYWNGAIGSTTIEILLGGNTFQFDSNEKHSCFKKGRGMQMTALQKCSYFMPRYEN
ncbi:MAG: hypothetical protein SPE43_03980 [Ruminococcus sp.]|nr:hypothetical protein [Oscillospiraceae bacterium]MDY4413517.1 hypothetical protein [Ruminococcus sp.]